MVFNVKSWTEEVDVDDDLSVFDVIGLDEYGDETRPRMGKISSSSSVSNAVERPKVFDNDPFC